ncbi:MAG: hypothetical protein JRF56_17825 [Deltaproteobacteria bacterium]|jgi:hypothetical protein|nr:hypothetical protein [Deltaproteobacteria bacterium]
MAKCEINAGICGFDTTVEAVDSGKWKIRLEITSDCPNIQKLAEELVEIDALDEIAKKAKSTKTYEIAAKHIPHCSCIVPSGIIKAVEVAAGLALPKNATLKMGK